MEDDSQDMLLMLNHRIVILLFPNFIRIKRVLKPGGLFAWTDVCPTQAAMIMKKHSMHVE
ncbi:MAG: hypothetical protein Ct9H300mP18_00020 [Candidatus Neomarinimicrobiota bacterium]|nr:MAG: hypothetical protein Ct9H300mP18_00020 [Candidatus Neomarinimicrobiota bacterium]